MENLEFKKQLLNQFSSMDELGVVAFLKVHQEKTKESIDFINILNNETLQSTKIVEVLNEMKQETVSKLKF